MKGEMRVIDGTGDTRITWDAESKTEIKSARKMFDDLVENKKYAAFSVKKSGEKHKRVYSFDSEAEKLIMVPPIQGG